MFACVCTRTQFSKAVLKTLLFPTNVCVQVEYDIPFFDSLADCPVKRKYELQAKSVLSFEKKKVA